MATFRFSLERLLRLRTQQAQQARNILHYLTEQRRRTENALHQLQHQHDTAQEEALQRGILHAHQLQEVWAYCQHLRHTIQHEQQQYEHLQELEQVQRLHLHEALKAEEILHRLRERRWGLFRQSMDRQEQRQLDEVAQCRKSPWKSASP